MNLLSKIASMLKTLCSLAAAASFSAMVQGGTEELSKESWSQDSFCKSVKFQDGRLLLSPPDAPWGWAAALGSEPVLFWSPEGASVEASISLDSGVSPGDASPDAVAFIGLSSSRKPESVQSAGEVVGLFIAWSKGRGEIEAWLGRKESQGAKTEARGDQWGNVPAISGKSVFKAKPGRVSVSLRFSDKAVSASVPELGYSQSAPSSELSPEIWRKACFLSVECRSSALGRGSLSVERVRAAWPRLDVSKFQCLDLRPFANMAFKDEEEGDRKGGWTDQGSNDLRHLQPGLRIVRGIPFDIVDPEANGGRSCAMLYSVKKDFLPKTAGPVKLGGKADSLIFLHSAAWAGKEGSLAAIYRAEYEDGSFAEIPIAVGRQLDEWWSLREPKDPAAALAIKARSDNSGQGLVGIYSYRWANPSPEKPIRSVSFASAGGLPVVGVIAVTALKPGLAPMEEALLEHSFEREAVCDLRKSPPDKDLIPDRIVLKETKRLAGDAFSAGGHYWGGGGGLEAMDQPWFAQELSGVGGILRYPHGVYINFSFWPYETKDWHPVFMEKGGSYGAISPWMNKGKGKVPDVISLQSMLAAARKQGFKLILQLNCDAMFDGKDFVYVKTLPEERMRRESPLESGKFSQANLDRIVASNASLVDYVISNGYKDSVAFWEMDNERWDMPGADYAATVAAHVRMLKAKLPDAKAIVCVGVQGSYSRNLAGTRIAIWNRDLLSALQRLGVSSEIDFFAPHEYPFQYDNAGEIVQNYLEDWCVRNVYRDLDYVSSELDSYGFAKARLYVSEWGVESDGLCCNESRNDLATCMASAIAAAKTAMAIYSHPRVDGGTLHPYLHASAFGAEENLPISKWGAQTLFFTKQGRRVGTPHLEAVKMFVKFASGSVLAPKELELPKGVNFLCARDAAGEKYFVVNSTASPAVFPAKGLTKRSSLFSKSVLDCSVRYGSYGDKPGDVKEILPRDFEDCVLPPFSVSVLR